MIIPAQTAARTPAANPAVAQPNHPPRRLVQLSCRDTVSVTDSDTTAVLSDILPDSAVRRLSMTAPFLTRRLS